MEHQILQIGGWAFVAFLLVGIIYLLKRGYLAVRDQFTKALDTTTQDRYMTKKETTQLFYELANGGEVEGTPDAGQRTK